MALINIYSGTVTAGGTNGTQVSTSGTYTAPVDISLDAQQNESKTVALAIRCESGYVTTGTTTISDVSDTNDRWKLCWTQNGTFADSITTEDVIGATNKLFYIKASSVSTELPTLDRSASLQISTKIAAA